MHQVEYLTHAHRETDIVILDKNDANLHSELLSNLMGLRHVLEVVDKHLSHAWYVSNVNCMLNQPIHLCQNRIRA